jgi:hypothetical protein
MPGYRGEFERKKKSKQFRKHKIGEKGKCGKRVYHTIEKAEEALKMCKERSKYDTHRHEIRYYWCNKCHGYHLTSEEYHGK